MTERRPDHGHYIHAVATTFRDSGFDVASVGGHDWEPRGGHIRLWPQDNWDDYRHDADVLWDERDGWRCRRGGITEDLSVANLASPAVVVSAVGYLLGFAAQLPPGVVFRSVQAQFGTPGFDAELGSYGPATGPHDHEGDDT